MIEVLLIAGEKIFVLFGIGFLEQFSESFETSSHGGSIFSCIVSGEVLIQLVFKIGHFENHKNIRFQRSIEVAPKLNNYIGTTN